jgi:hypothetical protein
MRISFSTRPRSAADAHISATVFGAWVITRSRSADQIDGWIGTDSAGSSPTDLDEIVAAIRRTGMGRGSRPPDALAA